jgi:tetratricopeptide (TPR) repeat protein
MPHSPFRLVLALGFLAAIPPLAAQDLAEITKVMENSKLTYQIGVTGPVKKPAEDLHCPERSSGMRVVRSPDGGKKLVSWEPGKEAAPHFEAAEKLFSAHNFAAAGEEYKKGLALDPTYGPGWLYSGDIPFAQKDFPAALTAYRKALELDPTLAQAHRFAADVLLMLGRFPEAQDEYVKALVYDPSYEGALEGLAFLGVRAGFTVARHEFLPPQGVLGEVDGGRVAIAVGEEQKQWFSYFICRAVWRNEPSYRVQRLGKAEGQGPYNWTLREETECLLSYLVGNLNLVEAELEKKAAAQQGQEKAKIPSDQVLAAAPPLVRHLKEVADAGLLPGYALYTVLGRRCPMASVMLPDKSLEDLERYIRRFVIISTPPPARRP